MKKIGIILSVVALTGMMSCISFEEGDSYQGFGPEPLVVYKFNDTTSVRTWRGRLLAPELSHKNNGDCLIASYTVYLDNKPQWTASKIKYEDVPQKAALFSESHGPEIAEGYTDSIEAVSLKDYTPYLDGKVFFYIVTSAKKNSMIEFNLTFVPTPNSPVSNEFNAYITTKLTSPETGVTERLGDFQVFDFKQIIMEKGLDTTKNSWVYKTIKVNFYYFIGFNDVNQAQWEKLTASGPFEYDLFK